MTKLGFSPHVSHLSSRISIIGLILLFPYISNVEAKPFSFESITTGNTSPYNHINENNPATWKNDLSGAAHIGNVNLVVDDLLSSVRIWRDGTSESTSITIPYHRLHRDVEGATQIDNYLIVSCSMTHLTDDSFNLLTRYQISTGNPITMTNGQSVVMRSQIMTAINNTLGQADPAWFTRIQTFGEKDGNLNVEGISATAPNSPYELVWGVRSPLFHPEFATFKGTQQVLNQGDAIVVFVKNAFTGIPQFQVETINLQGKGIRSIEYVPSLHGYLIVSGPVPKADSYRLWLWRPTKNENNDPILIDITDRLPQFVQLGRPEAIMLRANKLITIFSEEDPTFTINPPFNYIDAEITPGSDN